MRVGLTVHYACAVLVSSFIYVLFNSAWSERIIFFTIFVLDDKLVSWHSSHQSMIRFFFFVVF